MEGNFDRQAYESRVFSTQRFLPVAAPDYCFSQPVTTLDSLLGERLLVREPGSGTRNVLERALASRNLTVDSFARVTQLGSLNLIKRLVLAGMGIAFFYQPVVEESWPPASCGRSPWPTAPSATTFPFCGSGAACSPRSWKRSFPCCKTPKGHDAPSHSQAPSGISHGDGPADPFASQAGATKKPPSFQKAALVF